jgi:hypothetical protein
MKKWSCPCIDRERFYIAGKQHSEGFLWPSLVMYFKSLLNNKKRKVDSANWIFQNKNVAISSTQPTITWIGHSSFLIQLDGINILTDPVFGDISLVFRRIMPPGILFEQLPRIDLILILIILKKKRFIH